MSTTEENLFTSRTQILKDLSTLKQNAVNSVIDVLSETPALVMPFERKDRKISVYRVAARSLITMTKAHKRKGTERSLSKLQIAEQIFNSIRNASIKYSIDNQSGAFHQYLIDEGEKFIAPLACGKTPLEYAQDQEKTNSVSFIRLALLSHQFEESTSLGQTFFSQGPALHAEKETAELKHQDKIIGIKIKHLEEARTIIDDTLSSGSLAFA